MEPLLILLAEDDDGHATLAAPCPTVAQLFRNGGYLTAGFTGGGGNGGSEATYPSG